MQLTRSAMTARQQSGKTASSSTRCCASAVTARTQLNCQTSMYQQGGCRTPESTCTLRSQLTALLRPALNRHARPRSVATRAMLGGTEVVGSVAVLAATVFFALWTLAKNESSTLQDELAIAKSQLADRATDVQRLQEQLARELKVKDEAELYQRRYKENEKELFKLERALELKDGQLESFMNLATSQIQMLEGRVKKLQDANS